ncbi:MAG: hypothetical protein EBY20_05910 [Alphaproteobacteria bacterium]|jgi:hypothetical protein|nr:hypothetical protein [Alphaproteobacteria bacterium]
MKKIMFAVPEHAAEFVRAANLKDEGITKLDLGGNLIRGYVSELAEALKDTGVKELNMTATSISEGESIEFVDAMVREVGIDKLAIDHSETPAFTQKIAELEHKKSFTVDEALKEIVSDTVPTDVVNLIGAYDEVIEICPDASSLHFLP